MGEYSFSRVNQLGNYPSIGQTTRAFAVRLVDVELNSAGQPRAHRHHRHEDGRTNERAGRGAIGGVKPHGGRDVRARTRTFVSLSPVHGISAHVHPPAPSRLVRTSQAKPHTDVNQLACLPATATYAPRALSDRGSLIMHAALMTSPARSAPPNPVPSRLVLPRPRVADPIRSPRHPFRSPDSYEWPPARRSRLYVQVRQVFGSVRMGKRRRTEHGTVDARWRSVRGG